MNLSYLFVGYVVISVPYEHISGLLNLCMYYSIAYTDFQPQSNAVHMRFKYADLKRLKRLAYERGIEYTVLKKGGIPAFFERYRYRFGILLGMICACVLIVFSGRFVWSIDVIGNETLTASDIKAILKEYGFEVGSYIPYVNTDKIENRILMNSKDISWISINITGNVACVELREFEGEEKKDQVTRPANLVAKKSGLVEEVRIYEGNVVVNAGTYVEKGDLLVSGVFDSNLVGFRYTRAAGTVMARTTSEFYIEIPYEYEEIRYTGEEIYDKYLNFFGFSINISKNSRKVDAFYDKIDIVENCSLPDGTETPFEIHTVKYSEYKSVKTKRSPAEAERLAYFELSQKLAGIADEAIVIRKTVIPKVKEDSFVLMCSVVLVEDIASVCEFDVDLTE